MPPSAVRVSHVEKKHVLLLPKCGSTKLLHVCNKYYELKRKRLNLSGAKCSPRTSFSWNFQPGLELAAIIRPPEERLISCWRMLRGPSRDTGKHTFRMTHAAHRYQDITPYFLTFDDFVEIVLDIPDYMREQHTRSMWRSCCRDYGDPSTPGDFLPTAVFRWDWPALAAWLEVPHSVFRPQEKHNAAKDETETPEWNPSLLKDFRRSYWKDVELFSGCQT